jgi:S-methylmethionine-dependent homocysteine/selenocysteine methylase
VLGRHVLLLDGATGTELAHRGVPTPLPLWSAAALLTHAAVVAEIHRDYVAAGADILVANTFRTNPRALRRAGLLTDGPRLNRLAIELARQAAATAGVARPAPRVAASVAPVEDCYSPQLVPDEAALLAEHGQMVQWLAETSPDLLWIETMSTVREARAAARCAAEAGFEFVVSFVVRENGDLLSGEPLEVAVEAVEPFGPAAIGLNCIPPAGLTAALPRLACATTRPLAAYAHIGNPDPITGWSFSQDVPPSEYARHAQRWIELGARIVGGCCGTTPAHIGAVADAVRLAQDDARE